MKRRSLLVGLGCTVAAGATRVASAIDQRGSADGDDRQAAGLPRRLLGRTGAKISVVGFPGLALVHAKQDECTAGIHRAFENGVNYFDVAPAYGNGDCETKMGIGLEGIDRNKVFLSCKTKVRDREGARQELEQSLARLKTDHFDLYQLHCLKTPEEVKTALGPGGAMETILKAKEEGKIKHIGFSAHTTKGALAALEGFPFDTVMFPVNFVEFYTIGFGKAVLKLAAEKGAAVIAIKPVSRGLWPKDVERTRRWWYRPVEDEKEIGLVMRFALGLEGVVTGIPVSFLDLLDKIIEACREDRPNTEAETEAIRRLAAQCESVFRREEQQVASAAACDAPVYADSPHECRTRRHV
ncbi:MAG: aldo/keto reductase [Pirellulales bacterium]|nr:aldo/keto reductase [Pirellulales bacterium]